jgi:hypothetical protein
MVKAVSLPRSRLESQIQRTRVEVTKRLVTVSRSRVSLPVERFVCRCIASIPSVPIVERLCANFETTQQQRWATLRFCLVHKILPRKHRGSLPRGTGRGSVFPGPPLKFH